MGVLLVGVILCFLLYRPAINSPFTFDDPPVFDNLSKVEDLNTALLYVFSGDAGPSGRPLALTSFLIHIRNWPTQPGAFKKINVVLHALNGLLLALLLIGLNSSSRFGIPSPKWVAVISARFWMLHPMLSTTPLMAVQRMTLLMAFFVLLGLLLYVHGRKALNSNRLTGLLLMTLGLFIGAVLGGVSKENGLLIVLYATVLEWSFLAPLQNARSQHLLVLWRRAFLYLPVIAGFFWVAFHWEGFKSGYHLRPFGIYERLLSGTVVLGQYILKIFAPYPGAFGPFHDAFPVYRFWFQWQVILSSLFLVLLLYLAVRFRKKYPVLLFSVAWFFAGHAMESTFLSLELYFEHRNYLPLVGPMYGLVYLGLSLKRPSILPKIGLFAYGLVLVVVLQGTTKLWADQTFGATVWYESRPNSTRAIDYLAFQYELAGNYKAAGDLIRSGSDNRSQDAYLMLRSIHLDCLSGEMKPEEADMIIARLRKSEFRGGVLGVLNSIYKSKKEGQCEVGMEVLHEMAIALSENRLYRNSKPTMSRLLRFQSKLFLAEGNHEAVISSLVKAYQLNPRIFSAIEDIRWLMEKGMNAEAVRYLQECRTLLPDNRLKRRLWETEFDKLERSLQEDQTIRASR